MFLTVCLSLHPWFMPGDHLSTIHVAHQACLLGEIPLYLGPLDAILPHEILVTGIVPLLEAKKRAVLERGFSLEVPDQSCVCWPGLLLDLPFGEGLGGVLF